MAVSRRAMEYRSEQVWGSLPVVHVSVGGRQPDGRYRLGRARGVIAVGTLPRGWSPLAVLPWGCSASVASRSDWLHWARWPPRWWQLGRGDRAVRGRGSGHRADGDGRGHHGSGGRPTAATRGNTTRESPGLRRPLRVASVTGVRWCRRRTAARIGRSGTNSARPSDRPHSAHSVKAISVRPLVAYPSNRYHDS
jgi:hypothetical protein